MHSYFVAAAVFGSILITTKTKKNKKSNSNNNNNSNIPRKRTGTGPRRKTRSTAATRAVVAEATAVARGKGAATQAPKAAISQERNQLLNSFLAGRYGTISAPKNLACSSLDFICEFAGF